VILSFSMLIVAGPRRLRSAQSSSGWLLLKRRNFQSVRDELLAVFVSVRLAVASLDVIFIHIS
jgi:hypothetical protein